ncbi:very short patch repair endonuclease [Bifidobacterium primatium]|uniref:Very short patch repair endonuclease n=2 Tax=Bifidobacterium primatium TaxID=2045438 RepID=A0A2M9H8M2_9BIFI|nr:very short patch repair endonuclease [Bifidobacterium primatium]
MLYALQVAGSQNKTTAEKSSYMEPLLSRLRSRLFRDGFRFRKYDDRYPGPPDIALPKYRIMIFVDPCLWHDRSECKRKAFPPEMLRIWQDAHATQWEETLEDRQRLVDEGWTVLSYWECRFCDNRRREKRLKAFLSDVRRAARLSRQ